VQLLADRFLFLEEVGLRRGKKAFIVNRIGDAGFILGILLTAVTLGTIRFTSQDLPDAAGASGILQSLKPPWTRTHWLWRAGADRHRSFVICRSHGEIRPDSTLRLAAGRYGRSHPVSALIHAATMVTAGVYMVVRMNAVYQLAPFALDVVAVIARLPRFLPRPWPSCRTTSRKCSPTRHQQLGYMFLALGVGAFAAGIFHLMTHAFFKRSCFSVQAA